MLYIMRHGKTDWNEQYKLQGRTDIPLNAEGRAMAKKTAGECAAIPFDVCYCSPLRRAVETARLALSGRPVPIITDDRLIEMSFGTCEGLSHIMRIPDCPVRVLFEHPDQYTLAPEGGETIDDLFARTGEFLQEVALPEVEKGKHILIVGHGVMNSSIVCQVRHLPVSEFWSAGIENCKLMQLI